MSSIFTMNFIEDRANEEFLSRTFYPSPIDGITEYEVLNLDSKIKSDTIDKLEGFHWARSAIMVANSVDKPLDNSDYKILAVSPPTATRLESFKARYPCNELFANEHIEGTMVNVFYDTRNNHWEMSTKHAVGGKYWYYRTDYGVLGGAPNKTFRRMFVESFKVTSPCASIEENENLWLEEYLPFLNYFPKEYSYSFVLQHPANHIVYCIQEPCVYLVAIYNIGETIVRVHPDEYELNRITDWTTKNEFWISQCCPHFNFPARAAVGCGYEPLENFVLCIRNIMGIMVCDLKSGERAVIRSPHYLAFKRIRGNHPNMQYHFFEILQNGTLSTFNLYFPNYEALFRNFYADYAQHIQQVLVHYVDKFITKRSIGTIPKKYFVHIMRLHEYYKTTRQKINLDIVNQYFMQMTPGQLLFYLDYDNKKQQEEGATIADDLKEKKSNVWTEFQNVNAEPWGETESVEGM